MISLIAFLLVFWFLSCDSGQIVLVNHTVREFAWFALDESYDVMRTLRTVRCPQQIAVLRFKSSVFESPHCAPHSASLLPIQCLSQRLSRRLETLKGGRSNNGGDLIHSTFTSYFLGPIKLIETNRNPSREPSSG